MSMSSDDHMSKGDMGPARRIEVFTGAGRRRAWTVDQKAAIVAESYAGVGSVCDVARRHGLTPTQLFTWRRADRERVASCDEPEALFVPAVVDAPIHELNDAQKNRRHSIDAERPLIGVEIAGASLRVYGGADVATVMAIIRALKVAK